jgi:branched-chain amino acid transport system permease protein
MRPSPRAAALIALTAAIALAPLAFPSAFHYRVGALIFVNGLAVTGLVVLIGYAGQISLGHGGFAGIGAYAAALLPAHAGLPPALALVAGAALSGAVAWTIGRPILKLRGHYLAVATLGFGFLVFMTLTNETAITGGPDGLTVADLGVRDGARALGLPFDQARSWYWFSGLVLLAGAWMALNLRDSPAGRALRALHDSEVAARTLGVDVARWKLTAFVISAVYASVAGSLLAQMNRFVTPDVANFLHSVEWVTMAVLGGAGSVIGAILGAALLTALPQALTAFQDYEHLLLGLIMMLVMIFLREGVVPTLARRFGGRP